MTDIIIYGYDVFKDAMRYSRSLGSAAEGEVFKDTTRYNRAAAGAVGANDRRHKQNKMRKLPYIIAILTGILLFNQCINQKNITKMKIFERELVFPDISPEYKRLVSSGIKHFTKKKDSAIRGNADRDFYRYTEYNKGVKIQYNFNDEDSIFGVSSSIKIDPDDNKDFEKSIYFIEGTTYSVDGKLVKKELSLMSGEKIGLSMYLKSFEYDENGELIHVYDYSQNFKQSLPDILKTLEKYNLEIEFNNSYITGGNVVYSSALYPANSNYGKVWFVALRGYRAIIADDTGEIIFHNSDEFLKDRYNEFSITSKIINNYEWDIVIDKVK